jgi:hypothetical protein
VVGAAAVAAATVRVVAAATGRSAVGDNLSVALVLLRRSAGVGAATVWLSWDVASSTVGASVAAATSSFVVARLSWGRLADSVVDPHEVSFFSELGDDLSSAYALSLACDRCDRHEALLRSGVDSALDRLESFRKVADGKVVSEPPASFATLPVAFAPGVPVGDGFACRCISRQLVCGDVLQVLVFGRA